MKELLSTSERVYRSVKTEILEGAYLPGERLDAGEMAMNLSTSITPVRSALHQLVGEGLVEARSHEGFHIPRLTEPGLRDLCLWNEKLLVMALRTARSNHPRSPPPIPEGQSDESITTAIEQMFAAITDTTGNAEFRKAIDSANARLHAVRKLTAVLIDDRKAEFERITQAWLNHDDDQVEALLIAYHRRRQELVPDLVRLRHEPPVN